MEYERRELQRECLRQMTVPMLLELYKKHDELYYLPHCDEVLREVEYELREDILIVLQEMLDEQMMKKETPTLQEQLNQLYCRVITELSPHHLFDDDFQNAFQALSEAIEYHGGGKHKNYLYEDDDSADCVIIGAGGEVWRGSMPSWD